MWAFLGALLFFLHGGVAQRQDSDLFSFVTLPEVRALKFDITHVDRERQLPGYWFVAPYGQIEPENPTQKYEQFQIGPYIYDNDGMLVWAGSSITENRNVFDFKANWNIDAEPHLSFILQHEFDNSDRGSGVILNNKYEYEHHVGVTNDLDAFNMHEFNILDGGKTALACTYRSQLVSLADFGRPSEESWIVTGGFVELDVESATVLFEWDSGDHLSITDSVKFHPWDGAQGEPGNDYVHINAVDKNADGDYILSMRFASTIYMISGQDGHIMWRLGGSDSASTDFDQDFTFSKQHDVKFVSSNGTHHVISFMNNASDEYENEEDLSSALFVELDTGVTPMTARVIKRLERPDRGLTRLRGNVQPLPNGNTFVGWSQWGYHAEYAPNGDTLMYAQFASERFSSYRSYKFDWIGRPTTPPDMVTYVYGANDLDMMTIIHISWNGATDVAGYNFYARAFDRGEDIFIGYVNKTSFETLFIGDGYMDWISAEAIDKNGNVLGTTPLQRTEVPPGWKAVGFTGSSSGPIPDDPAIISTSKEGDNSYSAGSTSEDRKGIIYGQTKAVAAAVYKAYEIIQVLGGSLIILLTLCCTAGIVYGIRRFLRVRRSRSYQHIPSEEGQPVEQIQLRSSDE
ncbi:hypothetical protein N7476_007595 [Penicillium atrosanguineum]|uniref:ASST-domain-containing protein n=1 Tax=Penicillium atrosanguineum TaxID=1132637 RepID=A0A9W9PUR1_9EURO|nr:hypothetical protein N7476_007595 [Penicillium atrosanguineum]